MLLNLVTAAALAAAVVSPAAPNLASDCSASGSREIPGGYEATLYCSGWMGFISGHGTTLTDAAVEAQELVNLNLRTGEHCSGHGSRVVAGGYEDTLWCPGPRGWVDGLGSTLTAAARAARALASSG